MEAGCLGLRPRKYFIKDLEANVKEFERFARVFLAFHRLGRNYMSLLMPLSSA
jgi:hypothetical protein